MSGNAKAKQSNGAGKKAAKPAPSSTGTSTPVSTTNTVAPSGPIELVVYGSGRPDKSVYDGEQNKIKAEIDAVQVKLNVLKDKLSGGKGGPASERRRELLAELNDIRSAQGNIKQTRLKTIEQLKAIQDGIQKRMKDLQAAKAKVPFKTVAEVDDRVKQLEKQIESGSMKIADEKRALNDITQYKRNRRVVEAFQNDEEAIQKERAAADELRKQLDDPEGKAKAERYDAIQAELDELRKQNDENHAARGKLLDERTVLQAQLDVLYNQKRESAQNYREANDRHFAKVTEERARRAERDRARREEEEAEKKKEIADRLREEAEVPAFQAQIEDCQTLINHFSGKPSGTLSVAIEEKEKAGLIGVPELEIRKVEVPSDLVARKKKGEEDESYFVGGGGKSKKGKKGGKATPNPEASSADTTSSDRLHVPLPILSALLTLSIPPPVSSADVARVISDLETKRAWFVANQARVTAENKAKAERDIARLTGKHGKVDAPPADDLTPPNGGGELPAEPAPTPAIEGGEPSIPVSDAEVKERLEDVEESEEAEQ